MPVILVEKGVFKEMCLKYGKKQPTSRLFFLSAFKLGCPNVSEM